MITADDVIYLYEQINNLGIEIILDGGWGVDALLGEQTRPHSDIDIVIQQKDLPKLRKLLESQGYKDIERNDTSSWNFVLGDDIGHLVDVHAIIYDAEGNGLYGPIEKGVMYPAASLIGMGVVNGLSVRCISSEYLIKFHTGYKLRESDYKDVTALCTRFGINFPDGYNSIDK